MLRGATQGSEERLVRPVRESPLSARLSAPVIRVEILLSSVQRSGDVLAEQGPLAEGARVDAEVSRSASVLGARVSPYLPLARALLFWRLPGPHVVLATSEGRMTYMTPTSLTKLLVTAESTLRADSSAPVNYLWDAVEALFLATQLDAAERAWTAGSSAGEGATWATSAIKRQMERQP